jgi:hypothetical protein
MAETPGEAARKVADPLRRLPGEREAETSPHAEDASHWVGVYRELVTFKETLLTTIEDQHENVSDSGRSEVENDLVLMRGELERLRRRHAFWTAREAMLGSA